MDPEATWAIITDVDTDPVDRRDAALNLLVWLAMGGSIWDATGVIAPKAIAACEAVIIAEFEYLDTIIRQEHQRLRQPRPGQADPRDV